MFGEVNIFAILLISLLNVAVTLYFCEFECSHPFVFIRRYYVTYNSANSTTKIKQKLYL
jgi:hypothetical protein